MRTKERRFKGVGVSPGIAIGAAYVADRGALRAPEYRIEKSDVAAEEARFTAAIAAAREQLQALQAKAGSLRGAAAEEFGYLIDAHLHMLAGSRLVRSVNAIIAKELVNCEAAVARSIEQIEGDFRALDDPYMAARLHDVREVGMRLLRTLMERPVAGFEHVPEGSIIVADEITPADTALMDQRRIEGFVTAMGGAEGHTAIMARSLGLPAVLGLTGIANEIHAGTRLVIDGGEGVLVADPSAATLRLYEARRAAAAADRVKLAAFTNLPAATLDGEEIRLHINMELPQELAAVARVGASGVGLLRSEFMFMNRPDLPDEEEQYETLRTLVAGMAGRPLTVRTLDVGGDKLADALRASSGDGGNPALGLRAIRYALKNRPVLEAQLSAMLRAAAHGPLRILLPMISAVDEVIEVRAVMAELAARLRRRGADLPEVLPPVGVMIEVPAAALAADSLAGVADFFSIGTNDLTMYTLAIDRGNEQVAHLYDPMNPAVLRLVQFTTEAARRAGIPVNICGEMAGDERFTGLLVGLGLREMSMSPLALPRVKRRLRNLEAAAARTLAEAVMTTVDRSRISRLVEVFNETVGQRIFAGGQDKRRPRAQNIHI